MKGKINISYCVCLVLLTVVIGSCKRQGDEIPSMEESFLKYDRKPFGCYVLYQVLGQLFYKNTIWNKDQAFKKALQNYNDTGSLYISVSKNFYLSKEDREAMLEYVSKGNTMFVSSENIDKVLLDTLKCKEPKSDLYNPYNILKYTTLRINPVIYKDTGSYSYFYSPFSEYFPGFDSAVTKVLGQNATGLPNYILIFYGRGRFYFHCEPRALGNYFLLQNDNARYIQELFAFIPPSPEHIFWDDHYKWNSPPVDGNRSTLSVLFQYPALAWAFWLSLLILVLYILFGGKRRQRIIPILASNKNTTLAFTETVGRLYLQKKDNRNIADKIITYFMEFARNRYYLNTSNLNDDFITTLSRKSNVSREETDSLVQLMRKIQTSTTITDQELLSLNRHIEKFYKK